MAGDNRIATGNSGVSNIADLLKLFGGEKSTTVSSGDTSALQGVLGNLQGTDYNNVLQSIFTQAGGQIPGLTAGLSNAIGARSGGNSAIATALGKLLESTALKGADKVAQLGQNNQQMQMQAAQAIAQANKRSTSTGGTNNTKAAQTLGALQLGSKIYDSKLGQQIVGKGKGLFDSVFNPEDAATEGIMSDSGMDLFSSAAGGITSDYAADSGMDLFSAGTSDISSSLVDFDWGSLFSGEGSNVASDAVVDAGSDAIPEALWEFFADGGLVGRDGKKVSMDADKDGPEKETGFDPSWEMDEGNFPKSAPTKQPTPQTYADGGRVEPKVGTKGPEKKGGTGGGLSKEATIAKPAETAPGPKFTLTFEPGTIPHVEKGIKESMGYADGGEIKSAGGRASSRVNYDTDPVTQNSVIGVPQPELNSVSFQEELQKIAGVPKLTGAVKDSTGGSSSPITKENLNGPANTPGANATTARIAGYVMNYLLNTVVGPGGMAALNMASEVTGFKPPQGALSAGVGGLMGLLNPQSGSSRGPGATGNPETGTPIGYTTGSGTSYSDPSTTNGSTPSAPSNTGTPGGGNADGGKISGPGTGVSDSITAKLSKGEYVISADVVDRMGVDFFDNLQSSFHTPAAVQRKAA